MSNLDNYFLSVGLLFKKTGISLILILAGHHLQAQLYIEGKVIDASSNEVIPYCSIGLKGKNYGTLSNEEGIFKLAYFSNEDTLIAVNVSYKKKLIKLPDLMKNPIVVLERNDVILKEVVISGNNDFLYKLVEKCRATLVSSPIWESKAYFVLNTKVSGQPSELLECYYNASQNNSSLKELSFKNGRVGLSPVNARFFVSLNTSKAISFFNLTVQNEHFPINPLQLSFKKLKKKYQLKLLDVSGDSSSIYHLDFVASDKSEAAFNGEMWLNKFNGKLLKIKLQVSNTLTHPFIPLFPDGKVENVSMQLVKTYSSHATSYQPLHIDFNYQLHHIVKDTIVQPISTTGLLYFYDFSKPFVMPHFNYDKDLEDYRKISLLSYNDDFWNQHGGLVYTNYARQMVNHFKKNGILLNYSNKFNLKQNPIKGKDQFFENSNELWSKEKRIRIKQSGLKHDTTLKDRNFFTLQLYKLKAQIFLDINEVGDSVNHFSATVFDAYQTYYHLKEEEFTNCFINIYFDLVEIERRKLEKKLSQIQKNKVAIELAYKEALKGIERMEENYFKEVQHGKNKKDLKRYNDFVREELGIDNFELLNYKPE